jgi:hypothetical protein
MRQVWWIASAVVLALAVLAVDSGISAAPGQNSSETVPVHMVVTVEARHGSDDPVVNREDVMVEQGKTRDEVTKWVHYDGNNADLQLFMLIDDAAASSLGSQLDDLRKFVNAQPATTLVGVAYMRNGTAEVLQNLTSDHAQAAKALRLPLGEAGAYSSLYLSIEDLIKRWPESPARREVLMVSDGIDRFGGAGPVNPYVDSAIEAAERAGVVIYAIYTPGVGHDGRSFFRIDWGQNYLAEVADKSGGDAYFLGFGAPVSFAPFLDEVNRRLNHQYDLGFLAKAGKKPGLQPVKLRAEEPNAELVAAEQVYVPVGSQ